MKSATTVFLLIFAFAWGYAAEEPLGDTESRLPTLSDPELSPFHQKLHTARKAGDAEAVRELTPPLHRGFGEDAGDLTLFPCTTEGGMGDFTMKAEGFQKGILPGPKPAAFMNDVHVRGTFNIEEELSPSLASDSEGHLYAAWQDTGLPRDYIQLYKSTNGGKKWDAFAYVSNGSADLLDPCLAVGDGFDRKLLLTYIVDDGLNMPHPEVAIIPLSGGSWTYHSIAVTGSWEAYAKPVIWTDSNKYNVWYAYLTCEGIYNASVDNINVCTWKALNSGTSWTAQNVVLGNSDAFAWTDPDGAFGTTLEKVYVACFNDTDDTLYTVVSDDYGATYGTEIPVYTMTTIPGHPVDPEIAAAVNQDTVMLCCTKEYSGNDNIGQSYSSDAGQTWSYLYSLDGNTPDDEFAPCLIAGFSGKSWHVAYTASNQVMYSRRPQDLSDYWQSSPDVVNDTLHASHTYARKCLACNWTTDDCGMVWADFRDGAPDYDIYFESTEMDLFRVPSQFPTIQGAIDLAYTGCTVIVEPGRYMENINFKGKAITVKSAEGATWTFLNGRQSGSTVTFDSGEGTDSVLEGFSILNGSYPSGGGVYCNSASPTIRNNWFFWNFAVRGAAIFLYNSNPYITNNTIHDNNASVEGGGIYVTGTSSPKVRNSIFWNNDAPSGPEVFINGGGPTFYYCDIEGGWPGTGNINANPQFVESGVQDYHIKYTSPCRDAGWNGAAGLPAIDHEGDPRVAGGTADIGADEFHRHFYYAGHPYPGWSITGRLVDVPGTAPVGFWFGMGVLDPPWHSNAYGDWYLEPPHLFVGPLGAIPADGVMDLPASLPGSPPAPYELYLQAFIGNGFTNLLTIRVLPF